jgi:hypothetical protein
VTAIRWTTQCETNSKSCYKLRKSCRRTYVGPRGRGKTNRGLVAFVETDDLGTVMQMETTTRTAGQGLQPSQYEFIDSKELASRWALPESWIREQVRSRAADPLPHVRFGKYVRFRWGSPELEGWQKRRIIDASNRKAGRILGKETQ